jgi:hypothetical protein
MPSRRTFALTLSVYLALRARNGLQRALLAHGRRNQARGLFYPRAWTHE